MGLSCGIVGLPNVGKSTLFNALTNSQVEAANYPFCTIDPNVGVVPVPDARLERIAAFINTDKIVPTTIEFHDIAGLVRGAAKGEGLGNKFLGHIRTTDAIVHVLRCFDAGEVVHVDDQLDPLRDLETIQTELLCKDHETVLNALARHKKLAKTNAKRITTICAMLEALDAHMQDLQPARTFSSAYTGKIDSPALAELHLLTMKPEMYVCNVDESYLDRQENTHVQQIKASTSMPVIPVCAKIESELASLEGEEKQEMLTALNMTAPSLELMVAAGYRLLGLQTYFTAGEKEIKAWTIHNHSTAPVAAGKIHSDFQRGFICAEVYSVADLEQARSKARLKEMGLLRLEGKDYIVNDGDVITFRFNV
ncbi:MAG: redox-regulated ATPase YchF [Pseudomonadota bacterium]|nr:redox-regulated ATPase YchF [Pseudomonadota bacterium]